MKLIKRLISWFSRQIKKHAKALLALLGLFALWITVQMIGCGETAFMASPRSCGEFDVSVFEGGECQMREIEVGGDDEFDDGHDFYDADNSDEDEEGDSNRDRDDGEDERERGRRDRGSDESDNERSRRDRGSNEAKQRKPRTRRVQAPSFTYVVQLGKVDILFAVDNSHSMEVEHKKMADQFDDFLDDIEHLDYRIAIVTVDILRSPGNKRRDYQDGMFIDFDDGSFYLENSETDKKARRRQHKDNVAMFKKAIQRPETKKCRTDPSKCPDDERAICAIHESFDQDGQLEFFRKDGHLMMVVVSDEDERSSPEFRREMAREDVYYDFETCDIPHEVYNQIVTRIGETKSFSAHAIIIPPGDEACLKQQNSEGRRGYYGHIYSQFAVAQARVRRQFEGYRKGGVYSICGTEYRDQLGNLAQFLEKPNPIMLPCIPMRDDLIVKDIKRSRRVDFRVEGKSVHITDKIPINSKVKIRYTCDPKYAPRD